jgi:hypothetical protein
VHPSKAIVGLRSCDHPVRPSDEGAALCAPQCERLGRSLVTAGSERLARRLRITLSYRQMGSGVPYRSRPDIHCLACAS